MSDYEMLNQKIAEQKAAMRKNTIKRLIGFLGLVLATICAIIGLEAIGFISTTFAAILLLGTICVGAFNAGRIWAGFKR